MKLKFMFLMFLFLCCFSHASLLSSVASLFYYYISLLSIPSDCVSYHRQKKKKKEKRKTKNVENEFFLLKIGISSTLLGCLFFIPLENIVQNVIYQCFDKSLIEPSENLFPSLVICTTPLLPPNVINFFQKKILHLQIRKKKIQLNFPFFKRKN